MIEVKKLIPEGTIVEFTEFDDISYYKADEKKELVIGGHYLISEVESIFGDIGMILVIGKSGNTVLLKESQYRIVKPVQKSHIHYIGSSFSIFKKNFHYETEELVHDEYYVGGRVALPNSRFCEEVSEISLGILECEISGFTINNTGEL
jgi:hypothetical protein